ncbi:hypothetical protein A3F02_03390 [Candidatus Curtissbacteria bacterium RIFCSPHIGHO2_12_FULL_38_9b]|uniref:Tagatose-bisphosphate aldolase n=1 Tax=Candidatus Curtissbacteria bacterium RIFCSPHIGHO2_12_FULL_38_9b TaxID=1797720 RepID=A0A1F5GTA3_9BACT|nr:MAG: hypothetical protein A3F02_03390 [Candidatus Curtissbacteria bacterium RIFCSPHIGHO2_12_FULL_38_9b]
MTLRDWFWKAQKENYAIGAFNVDNLDIFKAICIAANKKKSPVMVEFSPGEVGYIGLDNIVDLVINARKEYKIPILLNLDHAKKVEDCLAAIESTNSDPGSEMKLRSGIDRASFDEVHFDGSELELSENIVNAKKVVDSAHPKNILVEGEIDKVPASSEVHNEEVDLEVVRKSYTNPEKAAKFVAQTGVDIFAAIFGNVHGTFPVQPDLDFALLERIKEAVGQTFLSLHGGSGIPADQVKEAIRVGKIVKVNVNTELRQAFRDGVVEKFGENPNEITYYKMIPDIIMAVAAVVEAKIDVFGSAGKI